MRTEEQIQSQISGLERQKRNTPKFSMFGNNNHAAIDAKISVLKGVSPDSFYQDETAEEYEDGDNDIYWEAVEAKEWLDGRSDEDLYNE